MPTLTDLPQVAVAQLGARMHYAVPIILHRAGMLERLYTDTYAGHINWLLKLLDKLPPKILPQHFVRLKARIAPLPPEKVVSFNYLSLLYFFANRLKNPQNTLLIYRSINKMFNRSVIKKITPSTEVIFGFDKSSIELFQWGKKRGLKCILDQASNPWEITKKIYHEANIKYPEWADDQNLDSRHPLTKYERAEWELADLILCPSEFVYSTFINLGIPQIKLLLNPYGVNIQYWNGMIRKYHSSMVLEIVYVGAGNLFKGLPFLIESIRKLKDRKVNLTIVGKASNLLKNYFKNIDNIQYIGQVPRSEVKNYYSKAHLFIFPSISEGSATVTYEALATGLPVITTPNSGSVVRDRIDGFIVPPMDSKAIVWAIEQFLEHPELVEAMSRKALQWAQGFSWEQYGQRLTACIKGLWD